MEMLDEWIDDDRADFALHHAMWERYVDTWEWANLPLDATVNVVAFSTGVGDGAYPVSFGYPRGSDVPSVALNDRRLIVGSR